MPRLVPLAVFALAVACRGAEPTERLGGGEPDLPALVERLREPVVNVDVVTRAGGGRGRGLQQGTGSGFFIDPTCLLLTNLHVVDGALSVRIRDHRGDGWEGTIVGGDRLTDLALVRVRGHRGNCPVAKLGDSSRARVGETVLAIGNPYGLSSTVTKGIISATAREALSGPYDEFLQTDAAINPGNSGGPLFNLRGEVIGINTAGVTHANLSFAIPIDLAKALLPQLREQGHVRRGWLGVALDDVGRELAAALKLPSEGGALVTSVEPKSPAAGAGLKVGEVVLAVDGRPVGTSAGLRRALGMRSPGAKVSLRAFLDGTERTLEVILSENPDAPVGQDGPRALASEDTEKQRRLGLTLEDGRGAKREPLVRITQVWPSSPAERAGLQPGMQLTAIDKAPTRSASVAIALLRAAAPDAVVVLQVLDGSGNQTLKALRIPAQVAESHASKE